MTATRDVLRVDYLDQFLHARQFYERKGVSINLKLPEDPPSIPMSSLNQLLPSDTIVEYGEVSPLWMNIVEDTRSDIELAAQKMSTLQKLQQKRLLYVFEDSLVTRSLEADIETISSDISKLLEKSQRRVKNLVPTSEADTNDPIATMNFEAWQTSRQALALILRNTYKDLRRLQAQYVLGLKKQTDVETSQETPLTLKMDFSENSPAEMRGTSMTQLEEVTRVAASVAELQNVFQDMNVLTIEQGTLLDRIDCTLSSVAENAAGGLHQMDTADQKYRNRKATRIIYFLMVTNMILFMLNVLKYS